MKKFWNKSETSNDIYIYGDITSYAWDDTDVTAKSFVEDLNSFKGQPVTLHLNSGGGDVFQALAIYNSIRSYKGGVTVTIDGLAASAASLIAMGGSRIKMASNALMMIHLPSVGLMGYYDGAELSKIQHQLSAVEDSIITTYETRLSCRKAKNQAADVRSMVENETWLNATEAFENGFIDEITDAVSMQVDDAQQMMFVNSLAISTKKFDAVKMRRAMEAKSMNINEQGFFDKLKNAITEAMTPKPIEVEDAAAIRETEIKRIRDLQGLKCDNAAVNAIIDVAISDGRPASEIKPFVDAIKAIPSTPTVQDTADKIVAVIRDQLTSGAEGVSASQEAPTAEDVKKAQAKLIADIANGLK